MVKLASLFAATLSVAALSGMPTSETAVFAMADVGRAMVNAVWISPGATLGGSLDGRAAWSESGSLLLLATGFFGAALMIRRRRQ